VKATLNLDFDNMIEAAWKGLKKGTPQYEQLQDAFFGGALCAYNRCLAASMHANIGQGMADLEKLNREIEEHHRLAHSRAKLWIAIQKAGEQR
jgi:hypothetical protein